jgi:dTDP-4-dehydrorhamnose reductase
MRVLLTGATGQLATDLLSLLRREHGVVAVSHGDLDVSNHAAVRARLEQERPDVVINTAAFHRVDDCEQQIEPAFRVNAFAVLNLARCCAAQQATLVHFSTDYVFGGDVPSPRDEGDAAVPISVYGASKLAGEHLLRQSCSRYFLIRTCGLYGHAGSSGKGGNFVETMLRLAGQGKSIRVVGDQVLTPTATVDLARKVVELLATEAYGLYHITNSGSCSWFEFTSEIFRLAGVSADLSPTTSAEYGAPARRPAYSVLRHGRLAALGLDDMSDWKDALARYLRGRAQGGPELAR